MNKQKSLYFRHIFQRHQPRQSLRKNIKSGIGGLICIASIAWLGFLTDNLFLMAPFGATCVLIFSLPNSPLSQPINMIGGHLISSLIGIVMFQILPLEWWAPALAVGLCISSMAILRVTHPPAGANPLVIFIGGFGWEYLIFPVLTGSLLITLIAWLFHKLPPMSEYPVTNS